MLPCNAGGFLSLRLVNVPLILLITLMLVDLMRAPCPDWFYKCLTHKTRRLWDVGAGVRHGRLGIWKPWRWSPPRVQRKANVYDQGEGGDCRRSIYTLIDHSRVRKLHNPRWSFSQIINPNKPFIFYLVRRASWKEILFTLISLFCE